MSADHLVVLGGGPNGLVCAAALAGAGRKVTLVEARPQLGGLAAGDEFHPGFRSAGVHLDSAFLRPAVAQQLDLERHGLRWRDAEPAHVCPAPLSGRGAGEPAAVRIPGDDAGTARALAALGRGDDTAFTRWREGVDRLAGFLGGVLDAPPPDLESRSFGSLWELGRTALGLRRLGKVDMSELLRVGPMCLADWLDEHFQNDRLKVLLGLPALAGEPAGPWSPGTALLLLMAEATRGRSVRGGPAAAVAALTQAAEARGVTLRTNTRVERLLVSEGAVRGVALDSGDELEAGAVLAACEPKHLFLDLVPRREMPPSLESRVRNWRTRGTTAVVHLALDGDLTLPGHDGPVERAVLGTHLDGVEQAFDPVKYGALPERPVLEVAVPSVDDPSLAPDGKSSVTLRVHFVTHALRDGWDDARREAVGDLAVETLGYWVEGVGERVLGRQVLTPVDLEERYAVTGGHLHHGEHALDQLLIARPDGACARYATPLDGLWLCGSGSHPGGGLTGMPGLLAAKTFLGR